MCFPILGHAVAEWSKVAQHLTCSHTQLQALDCYVNLFMLAAVELAQQLRLLFTGAMIFIY